MEKQKRSRKRKRNKKYIVAMTALIVAILFGGSFFDKGEPQTMQAKAVSPKENEITLYEDMVELRTESFVIPDHETKDSTKVDVNSQNYNQVALSFVEAIAKNDYQTVVKALDPNGNNFINNHDVEIAIEDTAYQVFEKYTGKEIYLSTNGQISENSSILANVTVYLNDSYSDQTLDEFGIELIQNGNNKWEVIDPLFYATDFYISIPGNVTLYIDDKEVSKDYIYCHSGYDELKDCYKIPLIGKGTKTARIVCDHFDITKEIAPKSTNQDSMVKIAYNLSGIELDAAIRTVETSWETMYEYYIKETPLNEWMHLFSEEFSYSGPKEVKKLFDELTDVSYSSDYNHHISFIQKNENAECFFATSNIVVMNIQYQLDWQRNTKDGVEDVFCRRGSTIILQIEDGKYKIHKISDPGLFNERRGDAW